MISIIVPVYNLEKYLENTLNHILAQTYKDIEILAIDDGSKDNSGKILDEYAKKDERLKVFHIPNGGAAKARNVGLDNMTGEYVTFIDGDDIVSDDYIERLYNDITNSGSDISICKYENIYMDNILNNDYPPVKEADFTKTFSVKEAIYRLLYQVDFDSEMWVKIYKSSLFDDIRFPLGNVFEDIAIIYDVFFKAKKISFSNHTGYYYFNRPDSTTLKGFSIKKMDLIDIMDRLEKEILEKYPEEKFRFATASKKVRANFHIYLQMPMSKELKEERKRIENNIKPLRKYVLKDKHSRRGTKIAVLITYLGFPVLHSMSKLKKFGKS
ncbi:Glycosyltransferase involved in cell wall bisynthesis [Lachnospiraceae bacterium RM5]|nr:Glycosyltransferase involved in cell wall bisynthesis [Lachnospiraceae bacterium RM5]